MTGYLMLWAVVLIAAVIAEAVTLQLVTIWFAAGAVAAVIAACMGMPLITQVILFTVVSALLLCVTRPLIKKLQVKDVLPTNADGEVGKIAVVTETVSNEKNTGRVRIGGVYWKARSFDGNLYPEGTNVCVEKISGTTVYVSTAENAFLKEKP
ncbi:MAG: NfeD family protein [Oscillospiraceae bacterium]|nr:NfeD family protein [Oscillospiraceae bacterium]